MRETETEKQSGGGQVMTMTTMTWGTGKNSVLACLSEWARIPGFFKSPRWYGNLWTHGDSYRSMTDQAMYCVVDVSWPPSKSHCQWGLPPPTSDCHQSPSLALLDFCPLAITSSPPLAKADLKLTASHVAKATPEPLKFLLLSLTRAGVTGVYHTAGGGSPWCSHLSLL